MVFCMECGAALPAGAKFCSACGKPIAPVSPAAPEAALPTMPSPPTGPLPPRLAPVRASGGGGAIWILPVLVFAAMLAVGYLLLMRRDRGTPPVEQAPVAAAAGQTSGHEVASTVEARGQGIVVSATTLDSAFSIDPDDAAVRYAGPITVTGTIASMVQPGSTPSLAMEGRSRFNHMVVGFPAGYGLRRATLSKGRSVTVSCDQVRSVAGTTILSGCLLR